MRQQVASFLLAVQFLTRIPLNISGIYSPDRMAASVRYYPAVGILIGALTAALYAGACYILPHYIAVLLAICGGLLITGAFHEDGLADTFDGMGGGSTRERALEIMKDSRLGTYGTLALLSVMVLKAASLFALTPALLITSLIAAHGLSRLSSVCVIATSRYVRDEGTGKPVAGGISLSGLAVAAGTGCLIFALWSSSQPLPALGFGLLGLVLGHVFMRLIVERKLGGYTGDTLGAVQQVSEIGFYLGVAAWA
ncbi:MAG: adenosylcobinamide-GDP ribazoletransferase [Pseudomonadota bacterium]